MFVRIYLLQHVEQDATVLTHNGDSLLLRHFPYPLRLLCHRMLLWAFLKTFSVSQYYTLGPVVVPYAIVSIPSMHYMFFWLTGTYFDMLELLMWNRREPKPFIFVWFVHCLVGRYMKARAGVWTLILPIPYCMPLEHLQDLTLSPLATISPCCSEQEPTSRLNILDSVLSTTSFPVCRVTLCHSIWTRGEWKLVAVNRQPLDRDPQALKTWCRFCLSYLK